MSAIITLASTTFVITLFATTILSDKIYNWLIQTPSLAVTWLLYILIIVDKSVCKCKHYKYVHVSTYNVDVKKATQPYTDKTTALLTTPPQSSLNWHYPPICTSSGCILQRCTVSSVSVLRLRRSCSLKTYRQIRFFFITPKNFLCRV